MDTQVMVDQSVKIHDFGFSFINEDEIKRPERDKYLELIEKYRKDKEKLLGLKDIIWPLLEELRKYPEKTHIAIPNRGIIINGIMDKINDYISKE